MWCSAFLQSEERAGSVCSWILGWRYSGWCPIYSALSRSLLYSASDRSAVDEDPGRWFVFLCEAASCYCAEPGNFSGGQGIWDFCFAHTEPKTCIQLWNAAGCGMAWGLYLLFPEGDLQSHKQPEKEAQGCPWLAGICEKHLWSGL